MWLFYYITDYNIGLCTVCVYMYRMNECDVIIDGGYTRIYKFVWLYILVQDFISSYVITDTPASALLASF